MAAYVVVEVKVNNKEAYEEYKVMAAKAVADFGGKFLVRGGKVESLEGDWNPERFVIIEFENMETAKRWWSSPEYTPAKLLRYKLAESKMLVAEGA